MIARIWKGAIRPEDGDAYAEYMQATGIAGYTRTQPGRAQLCRDVEDRCEFVMFSYAFARVDAGLVDGARGRPRARPSRPTAALTELERPCPHSQDLVVCHGDHCLPNVLPAHGQVSGFLDLGELGVATAGGTFCSTTLSPDPPSPIGWQGESTVLGLNAHRARTCLKAVR